MKHLKIQHRDLFLLFTFLLKADIDSKLMFEALLLFWPRKKKTDIRCWLTELQNNTFKPCFAATWVPLNNHPALAAFKAFMNARLVGPSWFLLEKQRRRRCQKTCCKAVQLRTAETKNSSGWISHRRHPPHYPCGRAAAKTSLHSGPANQISGSLLTWNWQEVGKR